MTTKTATRRRKGGHTEEERAEALAIAAEHGLAEAYRRTKVAKSTIHRWAKEASVPLFAERSVVERTEHAVAERNRLLAEATTQRVDGLAEISRLAIAEQKRLLQSQEATVKELAQVVGAGTRAHHDLRLETGQSTENHAVVVQFNVPLPQAKPPTIEREGS